MEAKPDTARILFVIKDGWSARLLLRTDLMDTVRQAGCEIFIWTPNHDEPYFAEEFADGKTTLLPLDLEEQFDYLHARPLNAVLKVLRAFVLKDTGNMSTLDGFYDKYRQQKWPNGGLGAGMMDAAIGALRRSRTLRRVVYGLENRLYPGPDSMARTIDRVKPDVMVSVTLGHFLPELYAMRQAQKAGVKLVTMVQSWDNDAKFGLAGVVPDKVMTWSDNMTQEMIRCHELNPADVVTVGVPHFDVYARPEMLMDRAELCRAMGLDPDPEVKILFFATKAPQNFPFNNDIVDMIDKAMSAGRLAKPCQLLVRLHPQHYRTGYESMDGGAMAGFMERYRKICDHNPRIVLNQPHILSNRLDMDRGVDDMIELGSILSHTEAVINPFSTLNVEASIFDVPVVNVGFDGFGQAEYIHPAYRSIALDEAHVHNQRMLATGCTRIAYTPEEMIDFTNRYLLDPELDRAGRQALVMQECGSIDGDSGRRAGLEILKTASPRG